MKNGAVPFGPFEHPPLRRRPCPRFTQCHPRGPLWPDSIDRDQRRIFLQLTPAPPTIQPSPGRRTTDPHDFARAGSVPVSETATAIAATAPVSRITGDNRSAP